MQIFYAPEFPNKLSLPEDEAHHCLRVLRHKTGDTIHITDGAGKLFSAQLQLISKSKHALQQVVLVKEAPEQAYRVHIALAPPKNIDRLEWFLEKAVEFGLDELSLLQCDHSERIRINMDRLQKKAISAMKQSLHLRQPIIHPPLPFKDFLQASERPSGQANYIAYVDEAHDAHLFHALLKKQNCCVLIGPEGDFSEEEIQQALAFNYQAVSLGDSRLRTETAALAACHIMHLANL